LFPESIAVSEGVFSEYCRQFGAWFSQRIAVRGVVFSEDWRPEKNTELTAIVCEKNRIDRNTLRKPPH
jgi:hypothetical protein